MSVTPQVPLSGHCDPRFEPVREAFLANFTERGEPGAAVCVSVGGRVVVDLWGGWSNRARTQVWGRDTLVNIFSVGKALTSICALRLVERGLIDLGAPVARLWPEFAAHDKDEISLRDMLSHRSALPALREPIPEGAMLDWKFMTTVLAAETPWWPPGTAHGYHVNTFGYLVGEVLRRVSRKTVGALLREEVAGPLGADVHIGLPASEHHRVAEFLWPIGSMPLQAEPANDLELMRRNAYRNPPGFSGSGWVNKPEWRSAEIPSTNGQGNARGIACIYAALANWGEIDGVRILSEFTLRAATVEHSAGLDLITQRPSRFGLGFQLTQTERPLGPNAHAFGHFGAGGSLGFCDPDERVAFGYVTNDMGPRWQNPRNRALIDAVYAGLRATP
ncbi:MAG: serine hydrolase domain-containing protein [Rhizomicrobium sp.]|jgi:CubicO group peptidase (beta-lactamase class C family)